MANWRNTFNISAVEGGFMSLLYKELLQINKDDEQFLGKRHGQASYYSYP